METQSYSVVIAADLRSYTHLDIEAASPEEAQEKALKQLKDDGDLAAMNWKWESETLQGEVAIQIEQGDFIDVEWDTPRYSELQAEIERLKTPTDTIKVEIHCLSFDDDMGTRSELYGSKAEADAALRAVIEEKWDEDEYGPIPDDDLHEAYQKVSGYLDTFSQDYAEVEIPCPAQSAGYAALHRIVADLAQCTTPEQEFNNPKNGHQKNYENVSEYIEDLSGDATLENYYAFMEFVRSAQETMAALNTDMMANAVPIEASPKIVIDMQFGNVERILTEGTPEDLDIYVIEQDQDIEEERLTTINHDENEIKCILSCYHSGDLVPAPLGYMTAVKHAWEDCS